MKLDCLNDNAKWLIDPNYMRQALHRLEAIRELPPQAIIEAERAKRLDAYRNLAAAQVRAGKGKVGVIPVLGPIEQRLSWLGFFLGGTSTEEIGSAYESMLSERSIDRIVFDVDSPGGVSYGIEELSDKIYSGRDRKPSYAIANSVAGSAAYWLATSASHMAVTLGGEVGSVGVFAMHLDQSQALEDEGIKVMMVQAGKYKTEYSPWTPLASDARDNLQTEVDDTYRRFLGALKRNRNTTMENVRKNYGEGRLFNSEKAKAAGMVDSIRTLDDLVSSLSGGGSSGQRKAYSREMMRMRLERRWVAFKQTMLG